jgi:hypothetical protein
MTKKSSFISNPSKTDTIAGEMGDSALLFFLAGIVFDP